MASDPSPHYQRSGSRTLLVVAAAVVVMLGIMGGGFFLWLSMATISGTVLVYQVAEPSEPHSVTVYDAVPAVSARLRYAPGGRTRVGALDAERLEITVPSTEPADIAWVKDRVASAGVLRFAILANYRDHKDLIDAAKQQSESAADAPPLVVNEGADVEGRWALVGRESETKAGPGKLRVSVQGSVARDHDTGRLLDIPTAALEGDAIEGIEKWLQQQGIANVDVLTVVEANMRAGGDDLSLVARGTDADNSPAINFKLNDSGSKQFFRLTLTYKPEGAFKRRLGIVLDDVLLSAPSINSPIRDSGMISGNFTQQDVDQIVDVLQAGRLPLALEKMPVSEQTVEVPMQLADLLPQW